MKTTLDLVKDISVQKDQLQNMFSAQGLDLQISSARQAHEMMKIVRREAEEKIIRRKGAEAQIESNKILADQHDELEIMRAAIDALLSHTLEQSKQQSVAFQERDRIEADRYRENTRLSKIAAWAGVISAVLAGLSILLQFQQ